ncbi:hypothetical protein GCM10017643_14880 [Ancylobacter dichloromethanicus]|uniref:Uncharacterized protein n=1 Tax=Ancylobacter dichloromethanicus TaxID=518825 RepID=A0A9W6J7W3_9HYPH|nr:hypothetical protein GCM10017643_14880 [Ancylobacter dichloromethanicus]
MRLRGVARGANLGAGMEIMGMCRQLVDREPDGFLPSDRTHVVHVPKLISSVAEGNATTQVRKGKGLRAIPAIHVAKKRSKCLILGEGQYRAIGSAPAPWHP